MMSDYKFKSVMNFSGWVFTDFAISEGLNCFILQEVASL